MIRVYPVRNGGGIVRGSKGQVVAEATRLWNIFDENGRRFERVAETRIGYTVVDAYGNMLTCWHIGMTPGDLARDVIGRAEKGRF